MGSVQQITLGVIILGAAFILGHYVNQQQTNEQLTKQAEDQDLDDATVWQKRPAPIKTMSDDSSQTGSFVDLNKMAQNDQQEKNDRLSLNKPGVERRVEAFPNIIQPATQEVEPDFSDMETARNAPAVKQVDPIVKKLAPSANGSANKENAARPTVARKPNNLADSKPAESTLLKPFDEADFAPQLKDHFANRLAKLREDNLTPMPDDTAPRHRAHENDRPAQRQQLADQIKPTDSLPVAPRRDEATREPGLLAPANKRLVPFRLNDEALSRLVAVSPRNRTTLRVESAQFRNHTILQGETLQRISAKYYGKPDFYLDIYIANQDRLQNPTDLPSGVTLRIPVY